MFCKNCGKQIPEGQTVCPGCGAQNAQPSYSQPQQQIIVNAGNNKTNGMATAGFTLALIGCFFSIAFILQLLGLIFSIVGLVKSGQLEGKGRGMAIAGLVLSILGFIPAIFLISTISSCAAAIV